MDLFNFSKGKRKEEEEPAMPKTEREVPQPINEEAVIEVRRPQLKSNSLYCETVRDVDGNVYNTLIVGKQIWIVENLKTTKYNDGTPINLIIDDVKWKDYSFSIEGAYCWYENNISNKAKYGALYNWYAVKTGNLAPVGWRVPSEWDWAELENYLVANGYNYDRTISGNKIGKSLAAQTDWKSSSDVGDVGNDTSTNNSTGFSALPGGCRSDDGNFLSRFILGCWWSSTQSGLDYETVSACMTYLHHDACDLYRGSYDMKFGFSVRVVRNLD